MSFLTFYELMSLKSKNEKKRQQQRANDKICLFIFWIDYEQSLFFL